jgi:quercetin dioxygenase-like cupin family protein
MSAFMRGQEVRREEFEWGAIGWRCTPAVVGAKQLVVMDVEILPGAGHDFHRHPVQEEVIIVTAGEIEQWVGEEVTVLRPGDSAFIVAGRVHASFNLSPETAHLRVVIAPTVGMGSGYELEDVSKRQPWASLRSRSSGAPAGGN